MGCARQQSDKDTPTEEDLQAGVRAVAVHPLLPSSSAARHAGWLAGCLDAWLASWLADTCLNR